jgi:hypothetical protein
MVRRRRCTGKKTAVVVNTVNIMAKSTRTGRKVMAKIVGAAGTSIMVRTGDGTTTVVVDAGATSITEV